MVIDMHATALLQIKTFIVKQLRHKQSINECSINDRNRQAGRQTDRQAGRQNRATETVKSLAAMINIPKCAFMMQVVPVGTQIST